MIQRCENCAHWRATAPIVVGGTNEQIGFAGECHKRAPVAGFDRYGKAATLWPAVNDDNGCGEWEASTP